MIGGAPMPDVERNSMSADANRMIGSWRKVGSPACAASYPAVVNFEGNGLYRGEPEPPAQFTTWDVGTWRMEEAGRVSISTANDAVVEYSLDASADELSFTDPDGCRFTYRRSG